MQRFLDSPVLVAGMPVGPFAMNQYIVAAPNGDAVIIDAGGPPEPFAAFAQAHGLNIQAILQTHAHIDHVTGVTASRSHFDVPVWLHPLDRPLWDAVHQQAAMFGIPCEPLAAPDHAIEHLQEFEVGSLRFRPHHTPGHCPGHICFELIGTSVLFGGDLLFHRSIGRTDLPGSVPADMTKSLQYVLTLDDSLQVFPGHMQPTSIGDERRANPFLKAIAAGRSL